MTEFLRGYVLAEDHGPCGFDNGEGFCSPQCLAIHNQTGTLKFRKIASKNSCNMSANAKNADP